MRDAPSLRLRLSSALRGRALADGLSARAMPQRVSHGQQNAYRCRPPGRDPGGCAAW
jgi:hypothetical protein